MEKKGEKKFNKFNEFNKLIIISIIFLISIIIINQASTKSYAEQKINNIINNTIGTDSNIIDENNILESAIQSTEKVELEYPDIKEDKEKEIMQYILVADTVLACFIGIVLAIGNYRKTRRLYKLESINDEYDFGTNDVFKEQEQTIPEKKKEQNEVPKAFMSEEPKAIKEMEEEKLKENIKEEKSNKDAEENPNKIEDNKEKNELKDNELEKIKSETHKLKENKIANKIEKSKDEEKEKALDEFYKYAEEIKFENQKENKKRRKKYKGKH